MGTGSEMLLHTLLSVLREILMVITPVDLLSPECLGVLAVLGPIAASKTGELLHLDVTLSLHERVRRVLELVAPHDLRQREVLLLLSVLRPVAERVETAPVSVS